MKLEAAPVVETHGRAASGLDNAGAGWDYQTVRVRLARRSGVRHRNQLWNPLKDLIGSNLVDMGRAAVHAPPAWWGDSQGWFSHAGLEATVKVCGVAVARPQGKSWAPVPSNG
jgi:hypothetical protein